MSSYNSDDNRRYWTEQLARPDALIIDGSLCFAGPEPTPADLAADPKSYGCYGTGFTVGLADGTQIITHNLMSCGAIPEDLRPVDNAAFIGEPVYTPLPRPAAHHCLDHLDYIGPCSYPYECLVCYRRFDTSDVPAEIADTILADMAGGRS
jgi:hypothetical protein